MAASCVSRTIRLRRTQPSPRGHLVPDAGGEGDRKNRDLVKLLPPPPYPAPDGSCAASLFRRLRLLVHHRIGQFGQRAVGLLLLVERRIEEPHRVVAAHLFGPAL